MVLLFNTFVVEGGSFFSVDCSDLVNRRILEGDQDGENLYYIDSIFSHCLLAR